MVGECLGSLHHREWIVLTGVVMEMLSAGAFVPVTHIVTTAGTGSWTIPAGATLMTLEAFGATGNGGAATTPNSGGGGGAGGYSLTQVALAGNAGQTVNYSVGAVAAATTISSGTFTLTTMTANAGGNGTNLAGGSGGTASGGTTTNSTGNPGDAGTGASGDSLGGPGKVGIITTGPSGANGVTSPASSPGSPGTVAVKFS